MDITFATQTAVVSDPKTGVPVGVTTGQHWPADDPVVLAYPSFFTDDPRYGLSSSRRLRDDGYPEGYPTEDDDTPPPAIEQATAEPGQKRGRGASRS